MRRLVFMGLLGAGLFLTPSGNVAAQDVSEFLPVGEMAPDIQVTGATRHGALSKPVKLSDLRGETVVLAFFFRARSGG